MSVVCPSSGRCTCCARTCTRRITTLHEEVGDVFTFALGGRRIWAVRDPAAVEDILVRDRTIWLKTDSPAYETLSELLGQGLVTAEGAPWLKHRRLAQPAFHREAGQRATTRDLSSRLSVRRGHLRGGVAGHQVLVDDGALPHDAGGVDEGEGPTLALAVAAGVAHGLHGERHAEGDDAGGRQGLQLGGGRHPVAVDVAPQHEAAGRVPRVEEAVAIIVEVGQRREAVGSRTRRRHRRRAEQLGARRDLPVAVALRLR
jgi:hypothetical protein